MPTAKVDDVSPEHVTVYERIVWTLVVEDVLTVSTGLLLLLVPTPLHCRFPVQPLAVRLDTLPAHTVALVTCTVAGGTVLTVIKVTLLQPGLIVQVTEYVLLTKPGLTLMLLPLAPLVDHTKVPPAQPSALRLTGVFTVTSVLLATRLTLGIGTTVTVAVAEVVTPKFVHNTV